MLIIENPVGREAEAVKMMAQARINILYYHAFFGGILIHLKPVMTRDVETMATDAEHIFFNPDYVLKLSGPEIEGVQVHECLHVALLHFLRLMQPLPLWNCATDFAINRDLKKGKFTMPGKEVGLDSPKEDRGHLFDARFEGMTAEQIMAFLLQRQQPPREGKPGQGQPQQGQGGQGDSGKGQSQADKPVEGKQGKPGRGKAAPGKGQDGKGEGKGDEGKGQGSTGLGEAVDGSRVGDFMPKKGQDGKELIHRHRAECQLVKESSWRHVLYGMGYETDLRPRARALRHNDEARAAFAEIRGHSDFRCSTLPTNRELIATARDRAFGLLGEGPPPRLAYDECQNLRTRVRNNAA